MLFNTPEELLPSFFCGSGIIRLPTMHWSFFVLFVVTEASSFPSASPRDLHVYVKRGNSSPFCSPPFPVGVALPWQQLRMNWCKECASVQKRTRFIILWVTFVGLSVLVEAAPNFFILPKSRKKKKIDYYQKCMTVAFSGVWHCCV